MNTKMKVLSLAMVGAFGYVGVASAACPASPAKPVGAWDSVSAFQGTAVIQNPGFAGTECRLDSTISAGAGGAASAAVNWTGTTPEPTYRAQFIIKADALVNQTLLAAATVFSAGSSSNGDAVEFTIYGGSGGARFLGYSVVNASNPAGYTTGAVPLPAGEARVEFKFEVGDSKNFELWINNSNSASPTKTETGLKTTAIGGIDTVYLGLAGPTKQFVTAFAGKAVGFDQFDSRRTTFIGF